MKNKLVCESLDEFVKNRLDEGILSKAKNIGKTVLNFITKIGKYYVAKFNNEVLNVGIPINIGLMLKNNKLDKSVYYIPSDSDLALEPQLAGFTQEKYLKTKLIEEKNDLMEFNRRFKTPESYFKFLDSHSIKESYLNEGIEELEHEDKNVPSVNTKELSLLILEKINNPEGDPLMIWGAPGIGKTAIINSVLDARKRKGRLIPFDAQFLTPEAWFMPYLKRSESGEREYVDLPKGKLPLYKPADRDDPEKERKDKEANDAANQGEGGIIFFDELSRATEDVQGSCLQLMGNRSLEEYRLGSKWVVIAASNRKTDVLNPRSIKFDPALGNRFNQVNFVPLYKEWKEWAKTSGVNEYILRFLDHNYEEWWYTKEKDNEIQSQFASPRSWSMASRGLASMADTCKSAGVEFTKSLKAMTIAKSVGKAAAEKIIAFMYVTDKYPIEQISNIWKDPNKAPKIEKIGTSGRSLALTEVTAVTLIAIGLKEKNKEIDPKEFTNFCKWLILLDNESAAGFAVRMLVDDYAPYMHPELGDYKKDEKGNYIGKYKEGGDLLRKHYGVAWGAAEENV